MNQLTRATIEPSFILGQGSRGQDLEVEFAAYPAAEKDVRSVQFAALSHVSRADAGRYCCSLLVIAVVSEVTILVRLPCFIMGRMFRKLRRAASSRVEVGWILATSGLIEAEVQRRETTFERHCVTYSAWFQGLSSAQDIDLDVLKNDREAHRDLMMYGIHPTLLQMSYYKEKDVDVALAISALEVRSRIAWM